jgi:hypothetical protein
MAADRKELKARNRALRATVMDLIATLDEVRTDSATQLERIVYLRDELSSAKADGFDLLRRVLL